MRSKSDLLKNARLYVLLSRSDAERLKKPIEWLAEEALLGGADLLQLRDKKASDAELLQDAQKLSAVTRQAKIPFLINDRIAIARDSGADGVHLGQEDASILEAKRILGKDALVGRSTHSLLQAVIAEQEGADYIGIGPIFATPTKPDYMPIGTALLAHIKTCVSIPAFAIGGIDADSLMGVLQERGLRVAVVRAAFSDLRVKQRIRTLKTLLNTHPLPKIPVLSDAS